ncbi:MAG: DUF1553 domain-containing protein, partial [Planctomycetaceae bacterium]|nr:DUF1553 domain-containing protein [Planctomycetaceae bacterium]
VQARLARDGISPSPRADRYTLIKRLYYDLLGLSPTPEAVHRFVADDSPTAYANLVDELLASPHFGERWGRHWLDKARYADSDGYEKDRPRYHAWKYRDWVINSINADQPIDQFTIDQLAGDLLPEPTENQLIATGFNRQTLTNTEGGTDQEEFRVEAIFDRVETLGTVWLGLTVGCARCHSHKYDDISQREYYQLFAFFNNADEVNRSLPSSTQAQADYLVAKAAYDARLKELEAPLNERREQLLPAAEERIAAHTAALAEIAAHPPRNLAWASESVSSLAAVTFQRIEKDDSLLPTGNQGDKDVYTLTYTPEAATDANEESVIHALRLDVLPDPSLPANGPGRAKNGNFVLSEITLDVLTPDENGTTSPVSRRVSFSKAMADHSQKDYDVSQAIDGKEDAQGWAIAPHIGKPHHAVFSLKEPLLLQPGERLQVRLSQQYERQGGFPHPLGRFKITFQSGQSEASLGLPKDVLEVLKIEPAKRKAEQSQLLLEHVFKQDADYRQLRQAVDAHRKTEPFNPAMPIASFQERRDNRRATRVLKRGEFLDPLGEVPCDTLHVLPELAQASSGNNLTRLDLATWLVSPENPLPARVLVNDIWSHLFGRGIVGTMNDFGVRGDPPTHPELLDWLATELMRLGWSRKQLIRTIVLSDTYQQSSAHRPELFERDPQNHLLARQNRFRVEAEIVRDLYLSASGLLQPRIGGPSVFPDLPPGIAELAYANNFKWGDSDWNKRPDNPQPVAPKDDRYRRGLYTFFKRTVVHPNLVTFDCPDGNTTCVERRASNTPLQALQTLNNRVFVEAAHQLAEQIQAFPGGDEDRIEQLFRRCVARPPASDERQSLQALLVDARKYYTEHPSEAAALAGQSASEDGPASEEQASWIVLARTVLNLDEFVTRE